MIELLTHTPWYVWVILLLIVWKGLKARRAHRLSWKDLIIMPVAFSIWSFYSVFQNYEKSQITVWVIFLFVGAYFGARMVKKLRLKFDKEKKLIEFSGSYAPLILSLSLFSLRFFLGATYGFQPQLKGNLALFAVEMLATVLSGMFFGRLFGLWKRSIRSPHVKLSR